MRPLDTRDDNVDADVVCPEVLRLPILRASAVLVLLLIHSVVPCATWPAQLPVDGGNGVDVVAGVYLYAAVMDSAMEVKRGGATSQEIQGALQRSILRGAGLQPPRTELLAKKTRDIYMVNTLIT